MTGEGLAALLPVPGGRVQAVAAALSLSFSSGARGVKAAMGARLKEDPSCPLWDPEGDPPGREFGHWGPD